MSMAQLIFGVHRDSSSPLLPLLHLDTQEERGRDVPTVLGIRRALWPLEIRPRNKKTLTIPVTDLTYGHSVTDPRNRGCACWE